MTVYRVNSSKLVPLFDNFGPEFNLYIIRGSGSQLDLLQDLIGKYKCYYILYVLYMTGKSSPCQLRTSDLWHMQIVISHGPVFWFCLQAVVICNAVIMHSLSFLLCGLNPTITQVLMNHYHQVSFPESHLSLAFAINLLPSFAWECVYLCVRSVCDVRFTLSHQAMFLNAHSHHLHQCSVIIDITVMRLYEFIGETQNRLCQISDYKCSIKHSFVREKG